MKRALLLGLLLAGCGSNVNGAGGGGASSSSTTDGGGGTGGGAPVPGSQSLTFGPMTLEPGVENTQCIQARLKNLDVLRAHQIHNELSPGSHHMIVYKTNDTEEKLVPYDCQPFVDTLNPDKGSPLMITQKHDETLTLPDGVAFSLDPNQMIRLEVHFINATADALDMQATTTFIPIADSDYKYDAGLLFLGDPDIDIAPHSKASLGPVFLPLAKLIPEIVGEPKFFAITGHEHQFGTNVKVSLAKDKSDPGTSLYDVPDWTWSEPETVTLAPEVSIPAGGGFKFSCDWDNTSDQQVKFGESANDEMCFFWAYYYPSKGAFVCAHTDQFGGYDLCCPGNPVCSQVFK